jgi:hypothetical protein
MSHGSDSARKQIDDLLNIPHQSWLLGAGISCNANIPLMVPLTNRISAVLAGEGAPYHECLEELRQELPDTAHIEHVLSQIGDLIAIAQRTRDGSARAKKKAYEKDFLIDLHGRIQKAIRDTVTWGYRPPAPAEGIAESVGTRERPIVQIGSHQTFINALFRQRRAGLERRPPVAFFTTNYDTLLEDSLALERIRADDGFAGGAMAFWEPSEQLAPVRSPYELNGSQASVFKLHGSVDWFAHEQDVVVRRREGVAYSMPNAARLLIYPQATKYQVTQRDPFASLFASFRAALGYAEQSLLAVCGYSFGDDHINEEIERALKQRSNRLTVLIFAHQPDGDLPADQCLPACVVSWLGDSSGEWRQRLVVAGRRGVYHGSLVKTCEPANGSGHSWWSFSGVAEILSKGTDQSL